MRSSIRNLIIVAVCAAVLGGALIALKLTGNDSAPSSAASSSASIELVSKKSDEVASMSVTNEKGSYTLIPVRKAPAAQASSGASAAASGGSDTITYTVRELGGCPVDTSATGSVVENGFSLVASRNLGTVSDLGEFGLKDPQATVRVSFKDGTSFNYKIGKASATDSSAYYMCGTDSDNVYIVTIDAGLLESAEYFVSKEILAITSPSGSNSFAKIELSGANYPTPVTLAVQGQDLKITAPKQYDPDLSALSGLEGALSTLTADSVEAVNPDAAALAKYGLDKPAAVAKFSVNGGNYSLTVGAKSGDDYYVMLGGVDVVYKAPATGIDPWASKGLFALRSKQILAPDVETVKSLTVTVGGAENVLNVSRTKDESKSTQDTAYYTYKLTGNGGKTLDYDKNYKNFYQGVIGISILGDASEKPDTAPALTLRYQYYDKASTDTVEFYQSGDRRYVAVLNGAVFGIVTQDDVDLVTKNIGLLESGQAVS